MKCDYCGRAIKGKSVKKMLRGVKHVFCTEMCFRFHFYGVPRFDLQAVYEKHTVSVAIPDFRELIKDMEGKLG